MNYVLHLNIYLLIEYLGWKLLFVDRNLFPKLFTIFTIKKIKKKIKKCTSKVVYGLDWTG